MTVCKHGIGLDDPCPDCNEATQPKKLADLQKEAEALRDATVKACGAELEAVLKKHGCKLAGQPQIIDGKIVAAVVLVAE